MVLRIGCIVLPNCLPKGNLPVEMHKRREASGEGYMPR